MEFVKIFSYILIFMFFLKIFTNNVDNDKLKYQLILSFLVIVSFVWYLIAELDFYRLLIIILLIYPIRIFFYDLYATFYLFFSNKLTIGDIVQINLNQITIKELEKDTDLRFETVGYLDTTFYDSVGKEIIIPNRYIFENVLMKN